MVDVIGRNVVPNFNYSVEALVFFRSKNILNKLNIYQKTLFTNIDEDLKIVIQRSADL